MENNFIENIKSVIIGIRFKRAYKLLDVWGSIVDVILDNNDYFSPEYFPKVSADSPYEKILFNEEKNNYIKLAPRDII
ncbi:MAG: hypothetical protein SCK28_12695, partial [Bacillota bacterium]|nr:hypothetical protein [Bacillota bacterium]